MALLLLLTGLSWSSLCIGSAQLKNCRDHFISPISKADRPRIIQSHFGRFSHSGALEAYALDLVARPGALVRAMGPGRIVKVEKSFSRGAPEREYLKQANYIVIEHPQGVHTLYSHLEREGLLVNVGDRVQQGQVIARVGCSGYCQSEHLHIEGFMRDKNLRRSFPIAIINRQGQAKRYFKVGEELFSRCEN